MTENGLITLPSAHGAKATADRLAAEMSGQRHDRICAYRSRRRRQRGRHGAAADRGPDLRQCQRRHAADASQQTIGIDLPLKALVWEDADGKVWLSYNDPGWIAQRHGATGVAEVTSRLAAGWPRWQKPRPAPDDAGRDQAAGVTATATSMRCPPEPRITPSIGATSV